MPLWRSQMPRLPQLIQPVDLLAQLLSFAFDCSHWLICFEYTSPLHPRCYVFVCMLHAPVWVLYSTCYSI